MRRFLSWQYFSNGWSQRRRKLGMKRGEECQIRKQSNHPPKGMPQKLFHPSNAWFQYIHSKISTQKYFFRLKVHIPWQFLTITFLRWLQWPFKRLRLGHQEQLRGLQPPAESSTEISSGGKNLRKRGKHIGKKNVQKFLEVEGKWLLEFWFLCFLERFDLDFGWKIIVKNFIWKHLFCFLKSSRLFREVSLFCGGGEENCANGMGTNFGGSSFLNEELPEFDFQQVNNFDTLNHCKPIIPFSWVYFCIKASISRPTWC